MTEGSSALLNLSKKLKNAFLSVVPDQDATIENYNLTNHWNKIGLACETVSKECTKLSLAYTKPPFPKDSEQAGLLNDVTFSVDILLSWYKTFPLSEGKLVQSRLEKCISNILDSVCSFLEAIHIDIQTHSQSQTVAIGNLWSCCEQVRNLPKDNAEALALDVEATYNLVSDALKETLEDIKSDENIENDEDEDEEEESWTADERLLLKPCIGLIMTCKAVLKQMKLYLRENCVGALPSQQIDLTKERLSPLSPRVDELVMNLYAPIDKTSLFDEVKRLCAKLQDVIEILRVLFEGAEVQEKLEFFEKAIEHNRSKLSTLLT